MTAATFRAGAARLSLEPPLGLPMVGFVRQPWRGRAYGLPLEVTASCWSAAIGASSSAASTSRSCASARSTG